MVSLSRLVISKNRCPLLSRTLAGSLAVAAATFIAQESQLYAQNSYSQHNLVSDLPGMADVTDTNLVNPWGIVASGSSPFWISDNHSGLSTLYTGNGTPQALVVTIPPPAGGTPPAAPTGVVFNNLAGFAVAPGSAGRFIFSTEDGTIVGWSSGGSGVVKADNSASGAVYKGLALGVSSGSNYLYAANFHAGTVDVFDTNYGPVTLAGSFNDATIPAGFAPFNIQNVAGQLFVTYAVQDSAKHDDVAGPGNGIINVFDTAGNFVKRFATSNSLNSPWGMAVAPTNFGAFSGALLVGNFGNGKINAFDPLTGNFLGSLQNPAGTPISIQGLWGLLFGNGASGGDKSTLYFTAGIPGGGAIEDHGLFGSISALSATFATETNRGAGQMLSWVSGTSPFLIQRKVNLADSNWVNVMTTTNRNVLLAREALSGVYRLQGLTTNTVLPFTALLNAQSEVPTNSSTASGTAALSLEGTTLNYYISFSGLSGPATAAHIHAPATPVLSSGVLVPLNPPATNQGVMAGTLTLTTDQITNLLNGLCYLNIHTGLNPNGEIRGQIVPLRIAVFLNGASEVGPVSTPATASGFLTLIGSQLFYDINYSGLSSTPTASHIHGPAAPGANANVIIPLNTPVGTNGSYSGTVSLTPTNMSYLLAGLTYLNIHTTVNAGGEIRGQIWPLQFHSSLLGATEVPAAASAGSGSGLFTVISNVLSYNINFTNLLSPATAAHIHGPSSPTNTAGVLIPFVAPAASSGVITGTATLTSAQLLDIISGQTYANIHTTNYGSGEIRGQVVPDN
jgi:uncharacterized protein (TIGR03118 family)